MLDSPNKRQRIAGGLDGDREKRPHSLSAVASGSNIQPSSRQIRKIHSYPATVETEKTSPQPSPSFSNKRKLSIKHKNSLNLTIFAPSYHEQLAGVRSAPINSNFNQHIQNQQNQHNRANYGKVTCEHSPRRVTDLICFFFYIYIY